MPVSNGWLGVLQDKVNDTFTQQPVQGRLFGQMYSIERFVQKIEDCIGRSVSETLTWFLLVICKNHICPHNCFIEHFRQETDVVELGINDSDEITKRILQPHP